MAPQGSTPADIQAKLAQGRESVGAFLRKGKHLMPNKGCQQRLVKDHTNHINCTIRLQYTTTCQEPKEVANPFNCYDQKSELKSY
eukprot:scaffold90157_cov14-Tisochrysis_lutea.AAC.1